MAVVHQATGTLVTSTGAALSVAWPAHQADDIGILVIEASGNSAAQTAPTGWTSIADVRDVNTTAGSRFRAYWRRATSGAMGNVTTFTCLDHQMAVIFTFRGCIDSGSPVDASASGNKGFNSGDSASTTATLPSVTTTVANALIVLLCGRPDDSASTTHFGTPTNANLTGISAGVEHGDTTGNGGGFVMAYGTKVSAGATGTTTMSKSASTTDTYIVIALAPVQAGGTGVINKSLGALTGTALGVVPIPPTPPPVVVPPGPPELTYGVGPWTGETPTTPLTHFSGMTIKDNLAGPEITFTMSARTLASQVMSGLASDLWVYRKNVLWLRCRILPIRQSWDEHGEDLIQVTAVGYRRLVEARHITSGPPTFTAVDQGDIGWQLIQHTQNTNGGFLGIGQGTIITGQLRDRNEYQIGDNIGSILGDLGKVQQGMWWGIDEHLTYDARLWDNFPQRTEPIVHGVNAVRMERNRGLGFANAAGAVGSRAATVPVWVETADIDTDPRGRWEAWDASHSSVIEQATVSEYANGLLAERAYAPTQWTIRVTKTNWLAQDWRPGDIVNVTVPASAVDELESPVEATTQITEVTITADEHGAIDVTIAAVELGSVDIEPPPPDPDPPVLLTAPSLSVLGGVWYVDTAWNSTTGSWLNAVSFAYQWQQSATAGGTYVNAATSSPGGSATSAVYAPPAEDEGLFYRCQVTATGPGGSLAAVSNSQQSVGQPDPIATLVPPDGYCWWGVHAAQRGTNGNANATGYSQWRVPARRYADALHFYNSAYNDWNGTLVVGGAEPGSTYRTLAELHPDGSSIIVVNIKMASNTSRANVAAGANDAFITSWANNVKVYPHRLIVFLDHEYDNNTPTAGNQPADHANAFRRWVQVARAAGADNVEWGWNPAGYSSGVGTGGLKLNQMWAGDDCVDWIFQNPYFTGVNRTDYARNVRSGRPWSLMQENIANMASWNGFMTWATTAKTIGVNGLAYAFGGNKPVGIGEWGTWGEISGMTDSVCAAMIRSVGTQWADWPQVKMSLHYNNYQSHDNRVDDSGTNDRLLRADAFGDVGALAQFNYGIENAP